MESRIFEECPLPVSISLWHRCNSREKLLEKREAGNIMYLFPCLTDTKFKTLSYWEIRQHHIENGRKYDRHKQRQWCFSRRERADKKIKNKLSLSKKKRKNR